MSLRAIVNSNLLSTNAPTRKKHLCTFTIANFKNSMYNLKTRENRSNALRDKLHGEHKPDNMDDLFGPISSLPKALMDKNVVVPKNRH